jgi:hypothetical protein
VDASGSEQAQNARFPGAALLAFVDHGRDGSGEPVAALLRPGNAGSNTALTTSRSHAWRWPSCATNTGAAATP